MIAQISFLCFLSLAVASPVYQSPAYGNPSVPIKDAKPQPYRFNYDVKDEYGTILNRQEEGDELGNKKGSYGYTDAYGLSRQVDYVADDKGFRAVVRTNEPGTEKQNPADVEIQSNAVQYQESSLYSKPVSAYGISSAYPRPALSSISSRPVASVYGSDVVNGAPVGQVYSTPLLSAVTPDAYRSVVSKPAVQAY